MRARHWARREREAPAPAQEVERERKPAVLRIQRVHPGEQVLRVVDLRAVSHQLNMLASHLERLTADDANVSLDKALRADSFTEAWENRLRRDQEIRMAILWALAERPDDGRYRPLAIEGVDQERMDATLYQLWRGGFIDASIPTVTRVKPGGLTTKGLRQLEKLTTHAETRSQKGA